MQSSSSFRSMASGLVLACAAAAPALAAPPNVGVSVNIGQPGVYGRVDIGNAPPPAVVYQQPIVVQPPPRPVAQQPVYLWVPPGHQRHWQRHCARYGACGVPVYFVQDRWYREHVLDRRGPPPHVVAPPRVVAPPPAYGPPGHAMPPPPPGYGRGPGPRDDRGGPGWERGDGRGYGR